MYCCRWRLPPGLVPVDGLDAGHLVVSGRGQVDGFRRLELGVSGDADSRAGVIDLEDVLDGFGSRVRVIVDDGPAVEGDDTFGVVGHLRLGVTPGAGCLELVLIGRGDAVVGRALGDDDSQRALRPGVALQRIAVAVDDRNGRQ